MLTKWKLFNFKAIQQETELTFKPLTIFAGANSSGKSTVLQSIQLIAQTLSNAVTNRPIVLNGDLVRLGQFDDLKSLGSETSQITIGWELEPSEARSAAALHASPAASLRFAFDVEEVVGKVRTEVSFDALSGALPAEVLQLQPGLVTMEMEAVVKSEEDEARTFAMGVRQRHGLGIPSVGSVDELPSDSLLSPPDLRFTVGFDEATESLRQQQFMSHEIEGVALRHFLPATILASFPVPQMLTEALMRALAGEGRPLYNRTSFRHVGEEPLPASVIQAIADHLSPESLLAAKLKELVQSSAEIRVRDIGEYLRRRPGVERIPVEAIREPESLRLDILALLSNQREEEVIRRRLQLPNELRLSCQLTTEWFSSHVKYLGPLRDDPKALYPLVANIDPRDVGLRGEHTAAVFHVHRDQIVEYLPSENFASPRVTPNRARRSLKFAVFEWLKYLGVATAVDTRDLGKLGHEMQVRLHEDDAPHDLTHVGVGVSQVLPIVVSCLLAEPDTMLIFEQPELHLHPKVQTLLGDFFLAMAMLGKQCVLETHSEYLINRLRFRAAAAEGKQLVETMQIYFVEKTGNQASFRPIEVNEYGAILKWPDGFFDQSQDEAERILREATNKRKQQQKEAANG